LPRPRSVTLLALALAWLAAFNALGALSGIRRYTFLDSLPLSLPPAYLILINLAWAAAFAVLAAGLWRLRTWARRGVLLAVPLYLAQGWLERLLFGRSDYARVTNPYFLLLHVASVAIVWAILLRRATSQRFSA
jgi:hypothetical protein